MGDAFNSKRNDAMADLAIDPDVLASELAAELQGDPLDEIAPDDPEHDALQAARACDEGLAWLNQGHDQSLQGLRVFCEHRDPRAVPLLLPLLENPCPVVRMSAVYALGRNPSTQAVQPLLGLLQLASNAYVRKATAWSLGNYSDAPVLNPLIRALQTDVASVRLWASVSLAEAGATSEAKADLAAAPSFASFFITSRACTSITVSAPTAVRADLARLPRTRTTMSSSCASWRSSTSAPCRRRVVAMSSPCRRRIVVAGASFMLLSPVPSSQKERRRP
mgnify:CR=1 FL=1